MQVEGLAEGKPVGVGEMVVVLGGKEATGRIRFRGPNQKAIGCMHAGFRECSQLQTSQILQLVLCNCNDDPPTTAFKGAGSEAVFAKTERMQVGDIAAEQSP